MSIKQHFFYGLLSTLLIQTCFAKPPFEVLRSCIDEEPNNSSITITDIDNGSYSALPEKDCEEQFEISYNRDVYGSVMCNDKRYLIIASKKISLETAVNISMNPEIKPGLLYPDDSSWLKIDFNHQSYLCINGPLSQSGTGSAVGQYYIVENAFKKIGMPKVYYYFFNKDIIPITSEHI